MHTVFRGYGSYKRSLLTALLTAFGQGTFMVKEASRLPNYSPRVFRRLVDDGLLIPVSTAAPRQWRISSGVASATGFGRFHMTDARTAAEPQRGHAD